MRYSKPTLDLSTFVERKIFMSNFLQESLSTVVSLSASFLVVLSCHGAEHEATGPIIKDEFASVQGDGRPYNTFSNNYIAPHAVLEKDIVFTAPQDGQGRPIIDAYDIKKKTWRGPIRASDHALGGDTHGTPSITIDAKAHLHVFFGRHGRAIKHVRPTAPYDINQWEKFPARHRVPPIHNRYEWQTVTSTFSIVPANTRTHGRCASAKITVGPARSPEK